MRARLRNWLSIKLQPPSCGAKIRLVASTKHSDRWDPGTGKITAGAVYSLWQTCGRRPGHAGEHGGYDRRSDRWRLRLANRMEV